MSATRISGTRMRRRWESIASFEGRARIHRDERAAGRGGRCTGRPRPAPASRPRDRRVARLTDADAWTGPGRFPVDETSRPSGDEPELLDGLVDAARRLEIRERDPGRTDARRRPGSRRSLRSHRRLQVRRLGGRTSRILPSPVERHRQTVSVPGGSPCSSVGSRGVRFCGPAASCTPESPAMVVAAVAASQPAPGTPGRRRWPRSRARCPRWRSCRARGGAARGSRRPPAEPAPARSARWKACDETAPMALPGSPIRGLFDYIPRWASRLTRTGDARQAEFHRACGVPAGRRLEMIDR